VTGGSRCRVVVTRRLPGPGVERLRADAGADVWLWDQDRPVPADVLARELRAGADGLLCMLTDRVDQDLLDAGGPRLRVISQMAAGLDNVDLAACAAAGVPVGHTPDILTETTADTAFALLAAAVRRVPEGAAHVRAGSWGPWGPEVLLGGDLHGTTLGLLGLGRIGAAVARRASGFSMQVLYSGPHRKPEAEAATGATQVPWEELLALSDHVVLTAPLSPATRGVVDGAALERMRSTATLVNVARGELVDTAALVAALRDGAIARAALDVTAPEPLPADHPLLELANCLVIPHLGSASVRTRVAMADLAVANLTAGLAGEPLVRSAPTLDGKLSDV